jgi:hypothetical protein
VFIALGGVVVYHIENHLDAGAMQFLHHVTKLIEAAERIVLVGAVRQVWSEERDGVVTPIIDEPRRRIRGIELIDRQKFHGCNAKISQVRNLVDDSEVCASMSVDNTGGWVAGKATHMHLVDDCVPKEPMYRSVTLPIEDGEIGHHTLHRDRGIVTRLARCSTTVVASDRDAFAVRIEQDLLAVESLTGCRIAWSVSTIAIELPMLDPRQEDMPIVRSSVSDGIESDRLRWTRIVRVIEQNNLHSLGAGREDAEVGPLRRHARAQRIGVTDWSLGSCVVIEQISSLP